MLTNILEFFRGKKDTFVKTNVSREHYMQQREIYVADQHRSIKAQLDKADKKYYSLQNLSSEK